VTSTHRENKWFASRFAHSASPFSSRPRSCWPRARAKTFDPDNSNRPDPETLIFLAKDKDGKIVASDVDFRG